MILRTLISSFFFLIAGFSLLPAQTPTGDQQPVENLKSLARLYGYVRYFHPSDEAAGLDWDAFLVHASEAMLRAPNPTSCKKQLEALFGPIAPGIQIFPTKDSLTLSMEELVPGGIKANYKPIAWQHLGVGLGMNGPYQSIRTNRPAETLSPFSSGRMTRSMEIGEHAGKFIRVEGYMKVSEESGARGHLWLEVRKEDGSIGLFDNMIIHPATSGEWEKYAATGRMGQNVKTLIFGAMLMGKGRLWLDDLVISVKEEDGWAVIFDSKSFEVAKTGRELPGWTLSEAPYQFSLSEEQAYQGKKAISITSNEPGPDSERLFEALPEAGDFVTKEIGNGLSCLIPLAVYGDKTHTLPPPEKDRLENLYLELEKEKLNPFRANKLFVRLAAVIKAWNIFQHFYPYFDVVDADWPFILEETLLDAFEARDEKDFADVLRRMTAHLQDGHIVVRVDEQQAPTAFLPLEWEYIEDELVITRVLSEDLNLAPGDIVTFINGVNTSRVLNEKRALTSAATEGWMNYRICRELLAGAPDDEILLKVKNSKKKDVELSLSYSLDPEAYQTLTRESLPSFREPEEGIYYMDLSRISMEEIVTQLDSLNKGKGVICDLRGYPNKNHGLIQYLLAGPDTSTNWMLIPQTIYPDQEQPAGYQEFGWEMEPLEPRLTAPVVFITDGRAISYAESFMSFIEHYDLATIVGQPTAGTNGNVNRIRLPGGFAISFTGMKVVKHDGSRLHGVGILPDVPVTRTIKGVRKGKDELLEAALKELK